MKEQFVRIISQMLGVEHNENTVVDEQLLARVEALESLLLIKVAEIEKMQDVMSVLIMANPHIVVSGSDATPDDDMLVSGSSPDRILN